MHTLHVQMGTHLLIARSHLHEAVVHIVVVRALGLVDRQLLVVHLHTERSSARRALLRKPPTHGCRLHQVTKCSTHASSQQLLVATLPAGTAATSQHIVGLQALQHTYVETLNSMLPRTRAHTPMRLRCMQLKP